MVRIDTADSEDDFASAASKSTDMVAKPTCTGQADTFDQTGKREGAITVVDSAR